MKTMRIFEGNGWFIEEYDLAANRVYVGAGRIGPVPAEETEQHVEFYRAQGAVIQDARIGAAQ